MKLLRTASRSALRAFVRSILRSRLRYALGPRISRDDVVTFLFVLLIVLVLGVLL